MRKGKNLLQSEKYFVSNRFVFVVLHNMYVHELCQMLIDAVFEEVCSRLFVFF